jgi:two-component system sensor histidine kinase PilS (NtrC family)
VTPALARVQPGRPADSCGAILHALAHKLSQPLTALQGILELSLLLDRTTEDYRRRVEEALEQIHRLVGLKQALSELAGASDTPSDSGVTDLGDLVAQLQEELGALAAGRGLTLELELETGLAVLGHPFRLQQAVLLFLDRLAAYGPAGSVMHVSLSQKDGRAYLELSNSQAQVSGEERRRMFEPFPQRQEQETDELGLAIAQRVIEAAGGRIEVTSGSQEGCTFQIWLPLGSLG